MRCDECGFTDEVPPTEVAPRLREVTAQFTERLKTTEDAELDRRPAVGVWSGREYGCHLRDVLWNLRDRILLALLEDTPTFAPIHREGRVGAARYRDEPASLTAAALADGGAMLAYLLERLDTGELARQGIYAGIERDVHWIGRQALHEATHHLVDFDRSVGRSSGDTH